ncbi:hypothetical protein [Fusobacterium polymorphum]|uniref:hypothetical protein n=1 Tax=Fusobacterium nucleatum subsp. polymorphum TaxID=76857 RepID=UPI003008D7C4
MFKKEFQKFKENYVILDNDEGKYLEIDYDKNKNLLIIFIKNKKLMISLKNFKKKTKITDLFKEKINIFYDYNLKQLAFIIFLIENSEKFIIEKNYLFFKNIFENDIFYDLKTKKILTNKIEFFKIYMKNCIYIIIERKRIKFFNELMNKKYELFNKDNFEELSNTFLFFVNYKKKKAFLFDNGDKYEFKIKNIDILKNIKDKNMFFYIKGFYLLIKTNNKLLKLNIKTGNLIEYDDFPEDVSINQFDLIEINNEKELFLFDYRQDNYYYFFNKKFYKLKKIDDSRTCNYNKIFKINHESNLLINKNNFYIIQNDTGFKFELQMRFFSTKVNFIDKKFVAIDKEIDYEFNVIIFENKIYLVTDGFKFINFKNEKDLYKKLKNNKIELQKEYNKIKFLLNI